MIWCKNIFKIGQKSSKSRLTYLFLRQLSRSKHWFDLDIDCIEDNFMTREPDIILKSELVKIPTFMVPIGIDKEKGDLEFHTFAPTLEYQQNDLIIYCFISLSSALTASR